MKIDFHGDFYHPRALILHTEAWRGGPAAFSSSWVERHGLELRGNMVPRYWKTSPFTDAHAGTGHGAERVERVGVALQVSSLTSQLQPKVSINLCSRPLDLFISNRINNRSKFF